MDKLEKGFKYCDDTIHLKENIENDFLELGERLRKIRAERLYTPQWENFAQYVEEMKMSEATASKLINIYQRFVLDFGITKRELLDAGGWSTAAELLPVISKKSDAKEWLEKSKLLSRQHLRQEITEAKSGVAMKDCEHQFYELRVCKKCNLKEKII